MQFSPSLSGGLFVLANCTREQAEEEERSLGPSVRLFLLK